MAHDAPRRLVVAIVGPTASGKSGLAIDLAQRLGGEVVNADAMQLYRGMDIGTAKVTAAERRGVPHHQLDVLDVRDEASVASYQRHSREDLAAIQAHGHLPVLAGGSGLYVRAALDRLEIPPTDPVVRQRLTEQLGAIGVEALHRRLDQVDPVAAGSIEPGNGRRIVRALEVVELTGQPFSATLPVREYAQPTVTIGLRVERDELDSRIDSRVQSMWEQGLLAEVEALVGQGLRQGRTASRALGYQQALDHLDGRLTAVQAVTDTATATRRFARRQGSWFRPDQRIRWLPAGVEDRARLLDAALAEVAAAERMRA